MPVDEERNEKKRTKGKKKKRIHLKSEHSGHETEWQTEAAIIRLTVFQSQDPHGVQCVNES